MPRLPAPGPSFLRELELQAGERRFRVGMDRPREVEGWWLTLLWASEDDEIAEFLDFAPSGGPPPGPPLLRLGPAFAGALSGLILEEDGRQQLRLRPGQPPADETRPWEAPVAVLAALRFEPARAATMRETELAAAVLVAFRRAVEALGRA
jgi:hypothetical protein